jgi:alkylresorcinol/alkylpyrone synthase
MPRIVSVATALPPNRCEQAETRDAMARVCQGDRSMERLLPVFDRTGVETRYLARPLDWYARDQTFEVRNGVYAECGLELLERAARMCLQTSGVDADQIDHLFFVTTTGLTTPSLDARVAARLGMRADVRRLPLFGLAARGESPSL